MEWCCKNRFLLLLCALVVLVQICGSDGCFEEEKAALLDFKAFAKFSLVPSEPFLSSWVNDSESDCCHWERVKCDSNSHHVIHLSLGGIYQESMEFEDHCVNSMSLNFSYFLLFKHLKNLDLSSGCLDDWLMTEDYRSMSTLTTLEILDLSHNLFDQSILKSLSVIKSLKKLIVAQNHIGGPVPIQELSVLENMELLDLSDNFLYSPLKSQALASKFSDSNTWSSLKKLRTLNLAGNALSKEILKTLAALPALKSLFLNDNFDPKNDGLDDKVLANLSNLETLILRNFLNTTTILPIKGFCKMKNLRELDLSLNHFNGTLDSCLNNLTSLGALDLSNNFLSGSVPPFIAGLTSLEYLRISHNKFEGLFSLSSMANHSRLKALILGEMDSNKFEVETENPLWIPSFQLEYLKMPNCGLNSLARTIPSFLSYQHRLRYIDISNNSLIDNFPNWLLANNPKLHGVLLNDNSFTGPFLLPSVLDQEMDQLQVLDISNNKIQGELPQNIGFLLPHLKHLNVSKNKFDGNIPSSIGEMSNLTFLDFADNNFSGKVPEQMFSGCISLEFLRLSNNSLEGEIFSTEMNKGLLKTLMLENNHFTGTLQDGLLSMVNLKVLIIFNNKLSGKLPGWLGKLRYLQILSASSNNFHGVIPNDLCQSPSLSLIDFSHNKLSRPIPSCLSWPDLRYILLRGNNLTGTIPKELPYSTLMLLDLRDNRIQGSIPEGFFSNTYLVILLLSGNQLQGHLPNQICQLRNLTFLDLSRNNFTGNLPLCFSNMVFGKEDQNWNFCFGNSDPREESIYYQYLHFGMDPFYERIGALTLIEEQIITKGLTLSYEGKILNYISGIDLSCNQLSGEIPKQIGDLHALRSLNLSHNQLSGFIPENFHNLKDIESLDLSYNHLSGTIPLQLQDLYSLSIFNVSHNNLSGRAPNQGQFGSFDENSYRGNPHLLVNNSNRGIITAQPLPSTPLNDEGELESPIDFIAFCWCFGASYVMILLVFMTILYINPYWRRRWFYFIETCLCKCLGRFLDGVFY